MTETEWLACGDPQRKLDFLSKKASDRKLRLYLCGGCRAISKLFFSEASANAVEVSERYADGQASWIDLINTQYPAEAYTFGYDFEIDPWNPFSGKDQSTVIRLTAMGAFISPESPGEKWEVDEVVRDQLVNAARLAYLCTSDSLKGRENLSFDWFCSVGGHWRWRSLLDCVFGNPFRRAGLKRVWRTSIAINLAKSIYADRAFDRLPILADALEDAGCTDTDILNHCRQPGEHVRGCWVIDLLLGKE